MRSFTNAANGACSIVGGGTLNIAGGADSGVFSGQNNQALGANSAILGGSGNVVPAAFQWAGVFGQNVVANNSRAFHANNFVAQDMPDQIIGVTCPTGTLYYDNATNIVYRVP